MEEKNMKTQISESDLFKMVEEGVSKKVVWQKPLLLLTKNGDDYNYISDIITDKYRTKNINTDATIFQFVQIDNQLEQTFNGEVIDYHHSDIDLYEYLGGPLGYDEKVHRFCVGLTKYGKKPVISFVCVADNNCSIDDIPTWMQNEFEIRMFNCSF